MLDTQYYNKTMLIMVSFFIYLAIFAMFSLNPHARTLFLAGHAKELDNITMYVYDFDSFEKTKPRRRGAYTA